MASNGITDAADLKRQHLERLESVESAVLQQLVRRASTSERAANDAIRHLRAAIEREAARLEKLRNTKPNNAQLVRWWREEPLRDVPSAMRSFWPELTGQARRREIARVRALFKRDRKANGIPRVPMPIEEIDAEMCTRVEWLRWCLRKVTRAIHEGRPQDVAGLAKAGASLLAELDGERTVEVTTFDAAGLARDLRELGPLLAALDG